MKVYRIVYTIFIASGHSCKWIKVNLRNLIYRYNACGGITVCYKQQIQNVTLVQ